MQNLSFLIETRCFKSKIDNILHIFNEGLTCFLHVVLIFTLIKPKNDIKTDSAEICINIITAAWALNMACSIAKTIAGLVEKLKKIREKSKVKNATQANFNNRNDHELEKKIEVICVEDLESKTTNIDK